MASKNNKDKNKQERSRYFNGWLSTKRNSCIGFSLLIVIKHKMFPCKSVMWSVLELLSLSSCSG